MRIGTKFNIFHHIKILTIISNIEFFTLVTATQEYLSNLKIKPRFIWCTYI